MIFAFTWWFWYLVWKEKGANPTWIRPIALLGSLDCSYGLLARLGGLFGRGCGLLHLDASGQGALGGLGTGLRLEGQHVTGTEAEIASAAADAVHENVHIGRDLEQIAVGGVAQEGIAGGTMRDRERLVVAVDVHEDRLECVGSHMCVFVFNFYIQAQERRHVMC
jgi:hypothetical protein